MNMCIFTVVLTGCMEQWPALGRVDPTRSWADLEYLTRVAGRYLHIYIYMTIYVYMYVD